MKSQGDSTCAIVTSRREFEGGDRVKTIQWNIERVRSAAGFLPGQPEYECC